LAGRRAMAGRHAALFFFSPVGAWRVGGGAILEGRAMSAPGAARSLVSLASRRLWKPPVAPAGASHVKPALILLFGTAPSGAAGGAVERALPNGL